MRELGLICCVDAWRKRLVNRGALAFARWRVRARLCLTAFGLSMSWAGPAEASDPRVHFGWNAPAGAYCATQAEIEARIERITARRFVASEAPHTHSIVAQLFEADEGRFGANVRVLDAEGGTLGTRRLVGQEPGCRDLDVSSAVVIATLLDGLSVHETQAPNRARSGLGLGAFGTAGTALDAQLFLGAGIELVLPLRIPVVLDASSYAPADLVDAQGHGARLWSFHAGVGGCPRFGSDAVQFELCVGAQGGLLRATPVLLASSERVLRPLLMVGVEPKLLVRFFSGVFARLSMAAEWLLLRPKIIWEIEDERTRVASGRTFVMLGRIGFVRRAASGH